VQHFCHLKNKQSTIVQYIPHCYCLLLLLNSAVNVGYAKTTNFVSSIVTMVKSGSADLRMSQQG